MIKFLDLQKVNAQYAAELKQAAAEVIGKGWFLLGERVTTFEQQFCDYIGVKHTIACANGLDSDLLGLTPDQIFEGDFWKIYLYRVQ
jgi:dTDP-4-amino-4,6-dideoxygalactose transaminase